MDVRISRWRIMPDAGMDIKGVVAEINDVLCVLTCLMAVQFDNLDLSLSAGGDVKQITTNKQLSDVIEVLLCSSSSIIMDS